MKWWHLLLIGILALGVGIGVFVYTQSSTKKDVVDLRGRQEVSVVLTEEGFSPRDFRITAGTKVTFTTTRPNQFWPASDPHPEHTIYSVFDPKRPLDPNESWSFAFNKPGTWSFHDHIRSYFTGTVYVE